MVGGDKLHQINERKTHPLMEDGGESRVIKNMKMNKIWDAVLGSSQQLQSFSLAPYLNFAQLKASIKEKKRRKNNFCYYFPTSFFS